MLLSIAIDIKSLSKLKISTRKERRSGVPVNILFHMHQILVAPILDYGSQGEIVLATKRKADTNRIIKLEKRLLPVIFIFVDFNSFLPTALHGHFYTM